MENSETNLLERIIAQLQKDNAALQRENVSLQSRLDRLTAHTGRPVIEGTQAWPEVNVRFTLEEAMHMREALQSLIQFHDWVQWNEKARDTLWTDAHHLLRELTVDYEQLHDLLHSGETIQSA